MAVRSKGVTDTPGSPQQKCPTYSRAFEESRLVETQQIFKRQRKHQIKHIRKQGGWKEKMGFAALGTFLLSKP